ncbi:DNA polymerase III subunit beta family protein [Kribbella deserti]|uniref:MerR family transcriptional regulator n=1 Tax=Kribbella deserti TaxID=1926257 RepID=A0ABV6QJD1_9ACTN
MPEQLLTISSFARLVGLTPSALRFYDDCGLLPPAEVDDGNGYRYYSPAQEGRATMLRDLREIDLPLAQVRVVLDAGPETAAEIIRTHLRSIELRAEAARQAAARILAGSVPTATAVSLGGAELASAIRQVSPAAATSSELPALTCVLLEAGPDEVKLVATDRYRLSIRQLHPKAFTGSARSVLVPAAALVELLRTLAAMPEVQVGITAGSITFGEVEVAPMAAEYPAYQAILDGLDAPATRLFVNRLGLLATLDTVTGDLVLSATPDGLSVAMPDQPEVSVEAICTGRPARIGFNASLLAAALSASVGPDVLLEIGAVDRPVVVRSADQGTFTTLVMPIRLDA